MGVFAYPRKKVQSGISSRLENDPLPLLSILTTTCMSMRLKIDGGDTEAVTASNMENPGQRPIVLERGEVEAL